MLKVLTIMSETKNYLELSQDAGSAHKFYEVVINGNDLTIRFGRIGDNGQSKTTTYATPEKAQAEATKKLSEKRKKGYEDAIVGVRQKRSITRREIVSSQSTANRAPVLWQFASGASAFGIFIDDQRCLVGNQNGQIFSLTPTGVVNQQFKLPDGVKCIVADDDWLYAGCDNGKVYDLNGKVPHVAYEIAEDVDIFWLDIADGILGVSDRLGNVTTINHEEESQWNRQSKGTAGWMVRCDEIGVYHGHSKGVTMYDWEDGRVIWDQPTGGGVLFGWQEETTVYVGTTNNRVYSFTKAGQAGKIYQCDSSIYSCATAADGKYVFAGDNCSSIYCFNAEGDRLWKLATGCGSAFSMQFQQDRLYIVTNNGNLACIDVSEVAITAAQEGTVPQTINVKSPKLDAILPSTDLERVTNISNGVVLQCVKDGSQLRMRILSEGYESSWNVQFPNELRKEGAKYLVDEVRESTRGGFYRAYGDIKVIDG
jgi:predicted DNA-binding WGR domain protein